MDHDIPQPTLPPVLSADLGGAWGGSSVNCKTYAAEGVVSSEGQSMGAFFDADGRLAVYTLNEMSGEVALKRFDHPRPPVDAHDTPSCQLDSTGALHVVAGAHVRRPRYLRSEPKGDLETLVDRSDELPDAVNEMSYPTLLSLADRKDMILLFRRGQPSNSIWSALDYSVTDGWSPAARDILSGRLTRSQMAGAYINLPMVFDDGRIGLAMVWRSILVEGGQDNPMNIGIDYIEGIDGLRRLRSTNGLCLPMPLTPLTAERIIAVPWGADLTNQCGACAIDGRLPLFVSAWRDAGANRQFHVVWCNDHGRWQQFSLTQFQEDFSMQGRGTLPMPQSRPIVVPFGRWHVAVIYRIAQNGGQLVADLIRGPHFSARTVQRVVLIEGGLDQYEPVAERFQCAKDGLLRMFVQPAAQIPGGDDVLNRVEANARFYIWDLHAAFSAGDNARLAVLPYE